MSKKDATFLEFALESLDNATALDVHVPEKPGIDELMASSAKPTTQQPLRFTGATTFDDAMNADSALGSGIAGTSSVVSGLASPATSVVSDESLQEPSAI